MVNAKLSKRNSLFLLLLLLLLLLLFFIITYYLFIPSFSPLVFLFW